MSVEQIQSVTLTLGEGKRLAEQLPLTMQPSLHGQLDRWSTLFAFERQRLERFLLGIARLSASDLKEHTRPLRTLEAKMGLAQWSFNPNNETMENSSLLARSAYFGEWRAEVQRLTAVIEQNAPPEDVRWKYPRLLITVLPTSLAYREKLPWSTWPFEGVTIRLADDLPSFLPLLLRTLQINAEASPANTASQVHNKLAANDDLWCIDAGSTLRTMLTTALAAQSLSYERMNTFRERFLEAANAVPKSIEASDRILGDLRQRDWSGFCPEEFVKDQRLRTFIVDLFLSGNGAMIYANSFVEWAASEAMRRARPPVMIARFGARPKPKPFTGIAIFENQERINKLPEVDDLGGSALDAQMLAMYVSLNARRYTEGNPLTRLCLCESENTAFLSAPSHADLSSLKGNTVSTSQLHRWIAEYLQS